jgi:hypothetical protein
VLKPLRPPQTEQGSNRIVHATDAGPSQQPSAPRSGLPAFYAVPERRVLRHYVGRRGDEKTSEARAWAPCTVCGSGLRRTVLIEWAARECSSSVVIGGSIRICSNCLARARATLRGRS